MIAVLLGTGTEVGKTTVATAWLRRSGGRALGWKPLETGGDEDQRLLGEACGRRVPAAWTLPQPVSPHRAARLAGLELDLAEIARSAVSHSRGTPLLVVETAGGMFSPLTDRGDTNADLTVRIGPDRVILVARDRLGVLHDVGACLRAGLAIGLRVDLVVLTLGGESDPTLALDNAEELRRLHGVDVVQGSVARADRIGDELHRRFGPSDA